MAIALRRYQRETAIGDDKAGKGYTVAFERVYPQIVGRAHRVTSWTPADLRPRCSETERAKDIVADLIASDRITESEAWAIEHLIGAKS